MDSPWPGGIAPRVVAARALAAIRQQRPGTAAETWAIVDAAIEAAPGCHADMVRAHVRTSLAIRHKRPTEEGAVRREQLARARAMLA